MIKISFYHGFPMIHQVSNCQAWSIWGGNITKHTSFICTDTLQLDISYILHQSFEHRFDRKLSEKRAPPILLQINLDNSSVRDFLLHLTSPVHHPHEGHKLDFCILGVDDRGPFETCLLFRGWKDINSTRFRQNLNVDKTNGLRSGSCVAEL